MRALSIFLLGSLLAACTPVGDYCDIYEPVDMRREVAAFVVANDRPAAEVIAANNLSFDGCPQ